MSLTGQGAGQKKDLEASLASIQAKEVAKRLWVHETLVICPGKTINMEKIKNEMQL